MHPEAYLDRMTSTKEGSDVWTQLWDPKTQFDYEFPVFIDYIIKRVKQIYALLIANETKKIN